MSNKLLTRQNIKLVECAVRLVPGARRSSTTTLDRAPQDLLLVVVGVVVL